MSSTEQESFYPQAYKLVITNFKEDMCRAQNRNCLLVHGVPEGEKDIYGSVINITREKMGINIEKRDLNYCSRLGRKSNDNGKTTKKPKPILVEFQARWQRDNVFHSKKKLKGVGIMVSEMLTANVFKSFKEIRKEMGNEC